MKKTFLSILFVLFSVSSSFATTTNDQLEALKILTQEGFQLISLSDSSKAEIADGIIQIGFENVLMQSPTYFKTAVSAEVEFKKLVSGDNAADLEGTRGFKYLSAMTNRELSDGLIALTPELLRLPARVGVRFKIKCIDTSGQGLNRIIWCGIKKKQQ